jgi:hypothetical protein
MPPKMYHERYELIQKQKKEIQNIESKS